MSAKILRALTNTAVVGGVLLGGWALMNFLSPSKEQMMKRLSIDPDEHVSGIQKRNRQLYEAIQQNINSSDPVWKVKALQVEKQSTTGEEEKENT